MKIIGTVGSDKLLLEATRDDVANLLGHSWYHAQGCPKLDVGMHVEVGRIWHQVDYLMKSRDALQQKANELRAIAALLEVKDPLYVPAVLEEPGAPKVGS